MVQRDADWIYKTLADAFEKESGPWESYSHIALRPIIGTMNKDLEIASLQLVVDYIEFETDD